MLDSKETQSGVPSGAPSATTDSSAEGAESPSLALYESSKTFLAKLPDPGVYKLRFGTVIAILAVFFVLIPVLTFAGVVPTYRLSILGKYLTFAIVALGIDLIWGYTGLLSLCQAIFFCIGGYAIAMHLSLPEGGGMYKIPQFMEFAYYGHHGQLPPFWKPFASLTFSIVAGLVLAAASATVFGFFIFRSRVRGVYFSIVTQAVALGAWLLICRNEMLLGGTNGLTNFYRPLTEDRGCIMGLYFLTLGALVGAYLLCRMLVRSRLGRVLVAVRDKETRLYFAGYQPYAFKVFAFAAAAVLAAIGGMLYSPQFYDITPQNMNVEASITMVIWVALGGRGKLWGAIFGALLVNYTYSAVTSDMASIWPYIQGGMFIIVVLLLPEGFVGFWDRLEREIKSGAPFGQLFFTALPLATVTLFILGEALGFNSHLHVWKYILVVALLGVSILHHFLARPKVSTKPAARVAEGAAAEHAPSQPPAIAGTGGKS